MSMPAETPWLLTTFPSRTHRTSRTTSAPRPARWSSKAQCVARRLPCASPERADVDQPPQQARILRTLLDPVTTRDDHDVERRMVGEGEVREQPHALPAANGTGSLGDEHHAVRGRPGTLQQGG